MQKLKTFITCLICLLLPMPLYAHEEVFYHDTIVGQLLHILTSFDHGSVLLMSGLLLYTVVVLLSNLEKRIKFPLLIAGAGVFLGFA